MCDISSLLPTITIIQLGTLYVSHNAPNVKNFPLSITCPQHTQANKEYQVTFTWLTVNLSPPSTLWGCRMSSPSQPPYSSSFYGAQNFSMTNVQFTEVIVFKYYLLQKC